MKLPPFVKAIAFWNAVSWIVAGVMGLLVFFGVLPTTYAWTAAAVLSGIQAVLKVFGIVPELRARGLL